MSNIYEKLYKTSCRDKSSFEEYAFITYLDEPRTYSIVKANRLIDIDSNNNGIINTFEAMRPTGGSHYIQEVSS